jgi:hypothetical protein
MARTLIASSLIALLSSPICLAGDDGTSTGGVTQRDNDVLVVALDRLVRDGRDDPFMPFDDETPLFFDRSPNCQPLTLKQVLRWSRDYEWEHRLTRQELEAVREAADHLVSRIPSCRGQFLLSHPRVELINGEPPDAGPLGKTVRAPSPGFSKDGRTGLVLVRIPWSMHGAAAAYVLTRHDGRWRIRVGELARFM